MSGKGTIWDTLWLKLTSSVSIETLVTSIGDNHTKRALLPQLLFIIQ